MEFHYGKHHATYINNLNALSEKAAVALESGDAHTHVDLSQGIKFNGGGHLNHEFFWDSLAPIGSGGGVIPAEGSDLHNGLVHGFGSVENFIKVFSAGTAGVQGSGWGWLAYNKTSGDLVFRAT
jgi:Fe-Mn family superoxide dismutase